MTLPIDIRGVIVCDDIRSENNGKAIIIGIYGGEIVPHEFPAAMHLAFYFVGVGQKSDNAEIEIRIQHSLSNGESPSVFAKASVAGAAVGRSTSIAIIGVPFNFDQPTELTISVKENEAWREIDRKGIVVRA